MSKAAIRSQRRQPVFVSWRWRVVIPVFVGVLVVAMLSAYVLASRLGGDVDSTQDNLLLEGVRSLDSRTETLYQRQLQEAQRIAFTIGVPEAVALGEVGVLRDNLEAIARIGNLDSITLTDVDGLELIGLYRVGTVDDPTFTFNFGNDLSGNTLVEAALSGSVGQVGLVNTPQGLQWVVSVPLRQADRMVGAVLVGTDFSTVVAELRGSALVDVALYTSEGDLLANTLALPPDQLPLAADATTYALRGEGSTVPIQTVTINGEPYRIAYTPFEAGASTLGIAVVFMPDSVPLTTEVGRQLTGFIASAVAGTAVVMVFIGVTLFTGRLERVQQTADALVRGQRSARTRMQAGDEVGAVGAAIDQLADRVQQEHDTLQQGLRRLRRETNHLIAVLEAMPEGVIVYDVSGQVTLMNDEARRLLVTHEAIQHHPELHTLTQTAMAHQVLGAALTPGVYTLGDPRRVAFKGRMLQAQAAAVVNSSHVRTGTVIVLRDITALVQREQERDRLMQSLESEVQIPMGDLARQTFDSTPIDALSNALTERAIMLHKLIAEIRELTLEGADRTLPRTQKPIRLDSMIWNITNDWRQVALAAGNTLVVETGNAVGDRHILGDERRLRWAIGNLIDNAIKYTPRGGVVTLQVKGEQHGQVHLQVRDNGVGILPEEVAHVTTRFYRGNPKLPSGEIIRTPGMGEGLATAKRIIESHGGRMKVESRPQVGTTVSFLLPLTSAEALDLPLLLDRSFEGETVHLPERNIARKQG